MKNKILDPKTINEDTIKSILENGAIEFHDNGGIYITEYPFNFWLELDERRKLIIMYSYWDVVPEAAEMDMLIFTNHSNTQKIMLQFSYRPEMGRFYGHYTHPYSVGLIPTHVLKMAQKFAAIFQEVVDDGMEKGLLIELPDSPGDDDEVGADTTVDSTVH